MIATPVLRLLSTVCTSMDGLWMLTMLLMRPGTALLILYCSASRTRSALRNADPAGYSGTTTPPWRIGCGAYGASFVGPGCGTPRAGGRGTGTPEVAAALRDCWVTAAIIESRSQGITNSGRCMARMLACRLCVASAFSCDRDVVVAGELVQGCR